jgi:hypothetical protein
MFWQLKTMKFRIENPCVGGSIPPRATKKHATPIDPVSWGFLMPVL